MTLPWYDYTQLRYLLQHPGRTPVGTGSLLPFERVMKAKSLTNKGLISTLYNLLSSSPSVEFAPHQRHGMRT